MEAKPIESPNDGDCKRNSATIQDVSDFLLWVKQMHTVTNDESGLGFQRNHVFYRGQASASWKLVPSLFRKENEGISEYHLYQEACRRLWRELQPFDNYLDKLIYFQHYGLPTRLLDITSNPLVALYFACSFTSTKEGESKDGAVYCTNHMEDNSFAAERMAKLIFTEDEQVLLYLRCYEEKDDMFFEENYMKPIFFTPPASNLRIDHQQGAFVMTPLLASRPTGNRFPLFSGNLDSHFDERKAIIPDSYKKYILTELAELGIDKGTLFMDATSKLEAVVQNARNKLIDIDV